MRNKYPGTCYRCGNTVQPGQGHFEKVAGGWKTQHAECARRWRGQPAPTVPEAGAFYRLYQHDPGEAVRQLNAIKEITL